MIPVAVPPDVQARFRHCADPSCEALDDVLMVGARVRGDRFGEGRPVLSLGDAEYLDNIRGFLPFYGFRLAETTRVRVANIAYDPDHDILRTAQQAQLVVFSFIYYRPEVIARFKAACAQPDALRVIGTPVQSALLQSPLADDRAAWLAGLERTGARVAVNIINAGRDGVCELPTGFLSAGHYRLAGREMPEGRIAAMTGMRQGYDVLINPQIPVPQSPGRQPGGICAPR